MSRALAEAPRPGRVASLFRSPVVFRQTRSRRVVDFTTRLTTGAWIGSRHPWNMQAGRSLFAMFRASASRYGASSSSNSVVCVP